MRRSNTRELDGLLRAITGKNVGKAYPLVRTRTRATPARLMATAAALALASAACGPMASPEVAAPGHDAAEVRSATPAESSTSPEPAATPTSSPEPTATPTSSPESTATEQEPTDEATPARVLERGDRGQAVTRVQQRLVELGYWLGAADGVYGALTEQAVLAFQGWEGITRDGRVGPETRRTLADARRPVPDHGGDLIEIHRSQGVLLVVRDGATHWAIHTSTGTNEYYTQPDGDRALADTPAGTWTIDWQVDGWRESFLGRLWRPKYFHEHGLAIHGYPEVPAWPASHGCARISMEAMNVIWAQGLAPVGSTVVVS